MTPFGREIPSDIRIPVSTYAPIVSSPLCAWLTCSIYSTVMWLHRICLLAMGMCCWMISEARRGEKNADALRSELVSIPNRSPNLSFTSTISDCLRTHTWPIGSGRRDNLPFFIYPTAVSTSRRCNAAEWSRSPTSALWYALDIRMLLTLEYNMSVKVMTVAFTAYSAGAITNGESAPILCSDFVIRSTAAARCRRRQQHNPASTLTSASEQVKGKGRLKDQLHELVAQLGQRESADSFRRERWYRPPLQSWELNCEYDRTKLLFIWSFCDSVTV